MSRLNGSRLSTSVPALSGAVLVGWPKPICCKKCKASKYSILPVMHVVQHQDGGIEFAPTPEIELRCMGCGAQDFMSPMAGE